VDNEDNYLIEIADQGAGIREDAMEHIFDPFYTTKDKGSGLGLSISLRIIENHGGTLEVREGTAGGATVAIRLPLKGEYGAAASEKRLFYIRG
jgi:signal transduction histidine kinase